MRKQKRVKKWSRNQVERLIKSIPTALMGRPTPYAQMLRSMFFAHFANSFFTSWYDASVAKSDGVADEFGNNWKEITNHTKIYRQLNKEERKKFKAKGTRGLLSASEDKLWRIIFMRKWTQFASFMNDKEAKKRAAQIAWTVVKSQGAKTKLREYSNREARILHVTGRLIQSLRPSSIGGGFYRPNKDQIAEFNGNVIRLGTSVPYATKVNVERPLVPPQHIVWVNRASKQAIEKIIEQLLEEMK